MTEQLTRNITIGGTVDPAQYIMTSPITGQDLVMNAVFNDMTDILYDPQLAARRRRLEWPTRNESLFEQLVRPGGIPVIPHTQRLVDSVISEEFAKCNRDQPFPEDRGCNTELIVVPQLKRRPQNQGELLKQLYYRGRQQSAIWDLFTLLIDRDFLSVDGLRYPINLRKTTAATKTVAWLLSCFELPSQENDIAWTNHPYNLWSAPFSEPVFWLATLIVRCGKDIPRLFDTIRASQFLGPINDHELAEYNRGCESKHFAVNEREREGNVVQDCPFGFWLPYQLNGNSKEGCLKAIYPQNIMRFNRIEEAFKAYFLIDDDRVLLEKDQEAYYDRFPEKQPGYAASVVGFRPPIGQWV